MHIEDKHLKDFILDLGLISRSDFSVAEKISQNSGESIGEVLVKNGKITADDLRKIQSQILGIPFISLKKHRVGFDILSIIPEPVSRNNNIVAFRMDKGCLEVALFDIESLSAIDFLKKEKGFKILPRFTDEESLKNLLLQYQKNLNDEFGTVIRREYKLIESSVENDKESSEQIFDNQSVVRIVETLLKHAVLQKASDIHIEPFESKIAVRYRIDGGLKEAMYLPESITLSLVARIKFLSGLNIDENSVPQDGRFEMNIEGRQVSFRVSIMPIFWGEKIVIRVLINPVSGFSLEAIGFHGEALEEVYKTLRSKTGMILSSGPVGSGKTTTVYTLMDILNTPDVNIATIEDPIEYRVNRVNQTQVKPEIGLDFVSGLRAISRQDPDIVVVGEILKKDVAIASMNTALKGSFVISTFNSSSSAFSIVRLLDMGVEPSLLVRALSVVVSRRLVGKLGDSREKYFLSNEEIKSIKKFVDMDRVLDFLKKERYMADDASWETIPFYKSGGLYKGKISINEVLKITPAIRDIILKNPMAEDIEKQAQEEGMMTLLEDGIFKAALGLTSVEEILNLASE